MTAREIEKILRSKHADDIFVAQCKTGPSVTGVQIFDGWALKPSWTNQLAIGYEIKVSRGDFLRDQKWRGYLPYCNEFYFVTPPGLVDKSEIADGAGLMVVAGNRLLTKKKATYHDAPQLEPLYKYILMYHSSLIKGNMSNMTREERVERWRQEVESAKSASELGWRVSLRLQAKIRQEIEDKEYENKRLKKENEHLTEVKDALEHLGYTLRDVPRWNIEKSLSDRLHEIETGFPDQVKRDVEAAHQAINKIRKIMGISE